MVVLIYCIQINMNDVKVERMLSVLASRLVTLSRTYGIRAFIA